MPTKHVLIKGNVQGVFYRASAKEVAMQLGIEGWIRNKPNGDVEAKISGNDEQVEKFIAWCKVGPKKANVTQVICTDQPDEFFSDFRVLR